MTRAKRIYILIIKVNKLFSFSSSWCFLKEIENMYFVCGSCSHSISRSPKLPLVFLYLTIIRRRRSEYCRIIPETKSRGLFDISIYTLSDLGVLRNLIGSLSLANEHYSPPTEWIMRKPNKNKMGGINSRFASVSESIFNGFLLKMLLRSLSVYILKQ